MKRDWKIKFSILMIIAAIIIFGTNYLVLKDTHSIVSYVWLHIGFIPIDIIIVAFILEDIMSSRSRRSTVRPSRCTTPTCARCLRR